MRPRLRSAAFRSLAPEERLNNVGRKGGASQYRTHDSFQRRFQGRGDGGTGVLREGGGCKPPSQGPRKEKDAPRSGEG